jgi:hypothetical protein
LRAGALAWTIAVVLALTLSAAVPAWGAPRARHRRAAPPLPTISVEVGAAAAAHAVPPEFLGMSFEVASLAQLGNYAHSGDLVNLLRSLGPGLLRFGGVTADTRVVWTDAVTPAAPWAAQSISTGDLENLATLAELTGWHVLLTLGLGHFEPRAAAREAAAARAALGPWLAGIEIGNEPNGYPIEHLRSEPWGFIQYSEQVNAYRAAIEAAAPGIPLVGPDTSGSSAYFSKWGYGEAVDQRPALLTGHHYALNCAQTPPPSIPLLLTHLNRARAWGSLRSYETVAETSETPFRLDETNTVSCGGVAGISNTFASALWAVSYLVQAMFAGVDGINLEGNPRNCLGYTPICAPSGERLARGELGAQPEWYALLLTKALVGDVPLSTMSSRPNQPNVEVATLRAPDGALHAVIVDDDPTGSRGAVVKLHVGRHFGRAALEWLRAGSLSALTGVTLGGRAVGPGGEWRPSPRLPHVRSRDGVIAVTVPPASACLATIVPR